MPWMFKCLVNTTVLGWNKFSLFHVDVNFVCISVSIKIGLKINIFIEMTLFLVV